MRKILFITAILFASSLQAQMTITRKQTGAVINSNDVIVFNTVGNTAASLDFYVNNTSATQIRTKIEFVSAVNADGTGMELCYGTQCLSDVTVGDSYPSGPAVIIPAMGRNGEFDHFYNTHVGNGSTQDYVFRFYQIDAGGNEVGNSVTLTYRYQPALTTNSFDDLNKIGIQIASNVIENQLNIKSESSTNMELIDLNGKIIKNVLLLEGQNTVDFSNLNSSLYLLKFTDNSGDSKSIKVIKK